MEFKIVTIKQLKDCGKWIEICYEEEPVSTTLNYNDSFKSWRLYEAIQLADMQNEFINKGAKGFKLKLKKMGSNWEIDSILSNEYTNPS